MIGHYICAAVHRLSKQVILTFNDEVGHLDERIEVEYLVWLKQTYVQRYIELLFLAYSMSLRLYCI